MNKAGLLEIGFYNPKDILFQHLSVRETVFEDNKNRYEEINCFRNGHITKHLTSVDKEELIRVGSAI